MEKKYGKKSVWQWIIIYGAIAAIAYGLIYYFGIAGKGIYSPPPAPKAPATIQTSPSKSSEVAVILNEENNSGESGQAILKEENGKTTVTVSLTGFVANIPQPAHIHAGSCPGVGTVRYPLTNIVNGQSITTVPVTLEVLKRDLPLAINVHKSTTEITNYTSCGELVIR